jgi:tetratricopeptide (TPR) repeat protein
MHHSSDRTLELLGELVNRFGHVPVLTILSGRTEPGEWLTRFPAATTVRVGPLSRADGVALVGTLVSDKPLAPEAANFFVDRANGNPLYLREMVAMARSRGALVDDGQCYRLTGQAAMPATLQALLSARLDALEPSQKLVLQHIAVIGEAATAEQVTGLGAPGAEAALRSLAELGFLEYRRDGRYRAADSLLRELAYETLPRNVRGELHHRAAGFMVRPEDRARHLDRAAEYLSDDAAIRAEAADALAEAGDLFLQASRHVDGLRLLERAVALGCRRPSVLLSLANAQSLCGKEDEARETLSLVPDDPDDPTVAIERDHTAANTKVMSDPAWAISRLERVAQQWHELNNVPKEAWAHANLGVAYFYLSRMEEAAVSLERGLSLFEEAGDRSGMVATQSFLCLAKPTDPRVPRWLAEALHYANESGDRSKQMTTLITLSWHHFFRSFLGRPEDMAEAEGFATRLAAVAQDFGAADAAIHAWSLLAIMARFTGRLEEAMERIASLQNVVSDLRSKEPWLSWAASFAVLVASGASGAAPPFPPEHATDPVAGMAGIVVEAELTLAGRLDEAIARLDGAARPDLGPISDLVGVWAGLALVLVGRHEEAQPWIERAASAARVLDAAPTAGAAAALKAEITGDVGGLPPLPSPIESVTDALVARAHARAGDADAIDALHRSAEAFAMPGLCAGI